MKRKTIALTLLCVMLMTLAFSVPTAAAEDGFVENGGFEEIEYYNGKDYWPLPKGWDGGTTAYDFLRVNKGAPEAERYMYYTKAANVKSPFVSVTPGESYILSFRTYAKGLAGADVGHRCWYSFYKEDGTRVGAEVENYLVRADGYWIAQALQFTVPSDASKLQFRVASHGTYPTTSWQFRYDDFKVTKQSAYQGGEYIFNGNMEYTDETVPTNMAIVATETGSATLEKTTKHSGVQGLKLTGTEETDAVTVKTYFVANPGTGIYDISAYMNVSELTAGSGIKLAIYEAGAMHSNKTFTTLKGETSFFTATGKGWRKMLLRYKPTAAKLVEVRITFSGAGTVYLDDISAIGTNNLIINGDMEGFSGDSVFVSPIGTTTYSELSVLSEGAGGIGVITDASKNQCLQVNNVSAAYAGYTLRGKWEKGARYKLSFDVKSKSNYGAYLGVTDGASGTIGSTPDRGETWMHHETFFTCTNSFTDGYTMITFGYRSANEANGYAYYDNISLVKVESNESFGIYNEEGTVAIPGLEAGKTYTAKYNNTTPDESNKVTIMFALYEKTEDGHYRLNDVQIVAKEAENIRQAGDGKTALTLTGRIPLTAEKSFTIPNDGKTYELRAMALDSLTNMKAYFEAVTA